MKKISVFYMVITILSVLLSTSSCDYKNHPYGTAWVEEEDSEASGSLPVSRAPTSTGIPVDKPTQPVAHHQDPSIGAPPAPSVSAFSAEAIDHWNKITFDYLFTSSMFNNFYMSNDCQHLYMVVYFGPYSENALFHLPADTINNNWQRVRWGSFSNYQSFEKMASFPKKYKITPTKTGLVLGTNTGELVIVTGAKATQVKQRYGNKFVTNKFRSIEIQNDSKNNELISLSSKKNAITYYKTDGSGEFTVAPNETYVPVEGLLQFDANTIQDIQSSPKWPFKKPFAEVIITGYQAPNGEAFIYVQGQGIYVGRKAVNP